MNRVRFIIAISALTLCGTPLESATASIFEQSYITPQRAGKSKVRWRTFDWKYVDFLAEENGSGGVRLFYYDRVQQAAEIAAAAITEEYRKFKRRFDITPDIRMPYILYATHLEFEEQNLFRVSETVLGVTSPADLTLSLPYSGDNRLFVEVSSHEMAHQFTIQKIYQVQRLHRAQVNPIQGFPLWFIEGLAEFYARDGLNDEVAMYMSDLLLNPDEKRRHKYESFWADQPRGFVQTYKLGQARIAYLAEEFGEDLVQQVLAKSYLMTPRADMTPADRIVNFPGLMEELTAVRPHQMDKQFKSWLEQKFNIEGQRKSEEIPKLEEQKAVSDTMDSYSVANDGQLVLYRDVDITTGESGLRLVDLRDEESRLTVALEGKPGIESLHFFQRKIFALGREILAYGALDRGYDVIYVHRFKRRVQKSGKEFKIEFEMEKPWKIKLKQIGLMEVADLAISPDDRHLAFAGLSSDGKSDIYLIGLDEKGAADTIRRLTDDFYSEKSLAWGDAGLLFSGDKTESGYFNLFLMDPDSGVTKRLTSEPVDHQTPSFGRDGSIYFTSYGAGKSNVYRLKDGVVSRLTQTHTGLFEPRDVGSGLLLKRFFRGRYQLFKTASPHLEPLPLTDPVLPPQSEKTRKRAIPPVEALMNQAAKALSEPKSAPSKTSPTPTTDADLSHAAPSADNLAEEPRGKRVSLMTEPPLSTPGRDHRSFGMRQIIPGNSTPQSFPRKSLDSAERYRSNKISDWRPDAGFFGLSTGQVGALYLAFSDRMRDQSLLVDVSILGDIEFTEANIFYINRKRRMSWGIGIMHNLRIRQDNDPASAELSSGIPAYLERDFGAYGILRYPFDRFTHVQLGLGLVGVHRFRYNALDPEAIAIWNERSGGLDAQFDLSLSGGYDTVGYHYATGPLNGTSLYGKIDYSYIATEAKSVMSARGDFQQYFRIWKGINLMSRAAFGTSFGDLRFRPQYFISSYDNLRSFPFGASALLDNHFAITNLELQIPLASFIQKPAIFQLFEGVIALDAGSIFDELDRDIFWENRTVAFVLGTNLLLGPFVLRLHFAKPLDIGGILPQQGTGWQTNFSMRYAFL